MKQLSEPALWQGVDGAGFLFLYLPLMFMVLFSFNSTRQDAEFTGFSLRWYEALTRDTKIVEGFWLSLQGGDFDRCAVGGAGHFCRLRAGALPALPGRTCSQAW
jgi:putrescine transport system permease protein